LNFERTPTVWPPARHAKANRFFECASSGFSNQGAVNWIKALKPRVLKKRFSSGFVLKQVKRQSNE
jgi:hypothetical protein